MLFFSEKKDSLKFGEEIRQSLINAYLKLSTLKFELNFTENLNFGVIIPKKLMSSDQRRFIRFPLILQARRHVENGETTPFVIREIGLGGCLTDWIEMSYVGEKGRIEILLQNGNWFPVTAKILYRIPGKHVGMKFLDMTLFEQEVIANLIVAVAEKQKMQIENPFAIPEKHLQTV